MLMRVRDERRMTIAAYQTVYEEGVGYGVRRQMEAEENVEGLEGEAAGLEMKRRELERRKEVLLSKKGSMEQKFRERKAVESEKREYEMAALIGQNKHLEAFLEKRRRLKEEVVEHPVEEEEI
jgi:dynein light intermediate chain